jgi:hypothetical protein
MPLGAWECLWHVGAKPLPGLHFFILMYLLYVDASGTPEQQDASRHYTLLGICIHEGTWFALNRRVDGLKRRFSFAGQDFELHVKEFAFSINEQAKIPDFENMSWTDRRARVLAIREERLVAEPDPTRRAELRRKYRKTDAFIHLSRLERSQLLEHTLDLVGAHEGIRLFGEAIFKAHAGVTGGQIDPVGQAFEQVVSRFDAFLQRRHRWKQENSARPSIDNGLLILDNDYSTEATLHKQFSGYRLHGHPWGKLRHVIDVPFFAASAQLCGLQLVDVCAYAVRRYLDKNAIPNSHEERNFLRIFQRFDRDNTGKLHGLRHYVPAGACNCHICHARGHWH